MEKTNPVLLYTEHTGENRPSTMSGTISADSHGRMIFRNNDGSITMIFVDIKDSYAIGETLQKSNIKLTLPQGDKTLFDNE
jgi:hypothetical protein